MDYYNKYFEGIFWVVGIESSKVLATMHVDDEGKATISSLQSLVGENETQLNNWEKISLVFGYASCHDTAKTYSVKLYDVYRIQYSIGTLTKFKYRSSNSFISPKFDKKINNLLFNRLMLNSETISDWIPTSGFKYDYGGIGASNYEVNQLYRKPKEIQLFKNDDYNIYFYFRASAGSKKRRTSYIVEDIFINIEMEKQLPPEELYKIKTIIERLFSIILFEPFVSTITELQTTTGHTYRDIKKRSKINGNLSNPIGFETFCQNSQIIFKHWFAKQEKFELFIKNFFSVYGQRGVLVENKFLTYISILENYHKNNVKATATLKERLKHILENSCIKDITLDIDNFSEKLKVTRNYHAHLEEKHEKRSLNVEGIDLSNKIIESVIRELMLKELALLNTANLGRMEEAAFKISEMIS